MATSFAGKFNAPEFPAGLEWVNTDRALTMRELQGKGVLPTTRGSFIMLGTGEPGLRDGSGNQALFSEPSGVSIANWKMYVGDANNHLIRVAGMEIAEVSTLELTGI